MADATMNEVVASVPDRFEYLESEGRIAFFPGTGLFKSGIVNQSKGGGGANVRLRITVNQPASAGSTSDYIARTNRSYNTHAYVTWEYYKKSVEFTISKPEIAAVEAEAKQLTGYVDDKIMGATEQAQTDVETTFWTATDMTTLGGPKGWLSGATFGGLTRADTVYDYTGGTSNVLLSDVLGTGTAYDYTNYAVTKPTRSETYWDVQTDYAAATDPGEFIAKVIFQLQFHIDRPGPKNKITHICMGKQTGALLVFYATNKPNSAVQYGMQKSLTGANQTIEGWTMSGAEVYISELIGEGDIFLINKNYTYVPALRGYSPEKWASEQGPSPSYIHATAFSYLSAFKFTTDAPIMHGWLLLDS